MLPRANNKNCVKVSIENDDDEDDLMMKVEEARNCGTQVIRNNYDEEKMEIEEPYDNKKPFPSNARRTENLTNEMKLINMVERRGQLQAPQASKMPIGSSSNPFPNFKGRGIDNDKQPLHSRNVRPSQVD